MGTSASNDGVKFVYKTHTHLQSMLTDSTMTSSNSSNYSVIDASSDNNGHQQYRLRQSSLDSLTTTTDFDMCNASDADAMDTTDVVESE